MKPGKDAVLVVCLLKGDLHCSKEIGLNRVTYTQHTVHTYQSLCTTEQPYRIKYQASVQILADDIDIVQQLHTRCGACVCCVLCAPERKGEGLVLKQAVQDQATTPTPTLCIKAKIESVLNYTFTQSCSATDINLTI